MRNSYGSKYRVEVENRSKRCAGTPRARILMLDNMTVPLMRNAVSVGGGANEISGNIDERRLDDVKSLSVDYISIGALTHSVRPSIFQ